MKDFKHFGLRVRRDFSKNYWALWYNLTTVRMDIGDTTPLTPERSEFYDVGLGTKCNANCPFCYVAASNKGEHWQNVCDTWNRWMDTFPEDTALPKDDPVLQDILKKPSIEDLRDMNIMATKLLVISQHKNITLTEKPFQIAIGI